jgi:Flp pilus assembly protein TadG
MRNIPQKKQSTRRLGATVVEFAVTCPILFLFFFAQIEFSRANMVRNALRSACHAGCREGIVLGSTEADVRAATETTLQNVGLKQYVVTVTPSVITKATKNVTVHITASIRENSWIFPFFLNGMVLENTMTMERELVDLVIY